MDKNEPFLPESEPIDNPRGFLRTQKKTLLLWLLLIFTFVLIYQLFAGPSSLPAHDAQPPQESASGWNGPWANWLIWVGSVGLFCFLIWRQIGGTRHFFHALEPGSLALGSGDLARAVEVFRAVEKKYRYQPNLAGTTRLYLGSALTRQGAFDAATEVLIRSERAAKGPAGFEIRARAAVELARLNVLRGELDVADRWVAEARKRLARATYRPWMGAQLRLIEALLACRRGDAAGAARMLDRDWNQLEEALTVSHMREAWVVRAFAATADERGDSGRWLALLRAIRPRDVDYLGRHWPEMQAFLATNDLAVESRGTVIR